MNARSARDSEEPVRVSATASGARDDGEDERERRAVQPRLGGEVGDVDGEAQCDEDDDLRQPGQRALEALNLGLVGDRRVAEEEPGDEDGQEARAAGQRRHGVQDGGQHRHEHRVEGFAGQPDVAQSGHDARGGQPEDQPDRHLHGEVLHDDQERGVGVGGELDHADHQRDAGRVVDAGLALQRGARAPADLAPAEDREHDGGVGRCQRRADDAGELPVHPQ